MTNLYLETLFLLVFCHFLADYPLQGDFIAKAKNHKNPIPGIPFYQPLLAHSFIHSGFVLLVTGSLLLALFELVVHTVTDFTKCEGLINYDVDQAIHILCKIWITTYFVFLVA